MATRFWIFIFSLALLGCSTTVEPTPTAEPPSPTPIPPTETTVPPTDTPEPTAPPLPPATDTPQPSPTLTEPPTETPEPTETPLPPVMRFPVEGQFTIYGDGAAVPNNNINGSGEQFTDPGGVVYHDGQFHMFHNGFTGWPATVDVVYSVSDDGINWTLVQENAIFAGNDLDYVGIAALASSTIVLDDGTWALYFYTWDDRTWPVSASSIGMATAPDPLGPWTALDAPILSPGSEGEWDDLAVRTPSVVATDEGYVMFYGGFQRNHARIGQAFSADGYTWQKYDDPATTETPHVESDPIFGGSGDGWDRTNVYQPRIRFTPDGWVMLYTAATGVGGSSLFQRHGLAYSVDGTEWIRSEDVIFEPRDVRSGGQNIWFTELEYALDTYYIYLELGTGSETEIYVATFDKSIFSR